ncbi:MAG: tRNA (adenosine(37)-N6)-threonylcarbamoyltransferase complex dimerization subunit type 1 TsaB [Verrucomicrobia bacterium]|nr:tRNA (adenosine(37)-N6)-threonylcarbamoyltransferase complex dimerization subunit type 1 TsaB [Verrucomicrobiota bacterium]
MKILALEFSSEQRSVAIASIENGQCTVLGSVSETGGRSTRAVSLIERALAESKLEREEIGCIAVGIGPGSYTGIRAAIALVQGWQLATEIKVLGISSAGALASQVHEQGLRGKINIVIDAQKNEFYLAGYDLSENGFSEVMKLHLTSMAEVEGRIAADELVFGPDAGRFAKGRVLFPAAEAIVRLACSRSDFISATELEPIYLRETNFVKAPPPRLIS